MAEETVLLSLDLSTTKTGYAIFIGNNLVLSDVVSSKNKDWLTRVKYMAETLKTLCKVYSVTHVVIEDTFSKSNINTLKKLCFSQGYILASLGEVEFLQVYPLSWKAYFGLTSSKHRANQKQASLSMAETLFIVNSGTDDESDAILMGKYVMDKGIGNI